MSEAKHFQAVANAFDRSAAEKYQRIWSQLTAVNQTKFDTIIFAAIKGNTNLDMAFDMWSTRIAKERANAERIQRYLAGRSAWGAPSRAQRSPGGAR